MTYANRRAGATTGAWPGINSFGGWKASGSTGRGTGGPYYVQQFMREQSRVRIGSWTKVGDGYVGNAHIFAVS